MSTPAPLGVIAGAGGLPLRLAAACAPGGVYVIRLAGMADPALGVHPGAEVSIGEPGKAMRLLKQAGVAKLTFAGHVARPDFKTLKVDARGALMLPGVLAAAAKGDDAILTYLLREFEKEGFEVIGAEQVLAGLLAPEGCIGALAPDAAAWADIDRAAEVAAEIGRLDIGQGCVVAGGLVLAVEAQEGTDAMLLRVAGLPPAIRGSPDDRRGVLVKRAKPQQERRIDLPTIGVRTIEGAARAGLAGVAVEAGGALVVDRAAVAAAGDAAGVFVIGFRPRT
jgi:hypothetical protein